VDGIGDGKNMLTERVRVTGRCVDSLEEDLCVRIEHRVKKVTFCPTRSFIHVELLDCTEVSGRLMLIWAQMEISFEGQVYTLQRMVQQTAPIESNQYGFSMVNEVATALMFTPKQRFN
jgi:hypothetical protein